MTYILAVIILARVLFDFVSAFRPKPIYDVIYIFLLIFVGISLLQDSTRDSKDLWFGLLAVGGALIWAICLVRKLGTSADKANE